VGLLSLPGFRSGLKKKIRASPFYRTATTVCLCCLPALEDWTGADRRRLALGGESNLFVLIFAIVSQSKNKCSFNRLHFGKKQM
jgi:hypothetical protein